MAQRQSSGAEHRVRVLAHSTRAGQAELEAAQPPPPPPPPERLLNCFVRSVALIERVGNALGALAFTWATVVLLGGYPTALRADSDFWFATTVFFLEAARMFSSKNRTDYRLFFGTRGAFRPLGWNGLIILVCFNGVTCMIVVALKLDWLRQIIMLLLMGVLVAVGQFVCPGVPGMLVRNQECRRLVSLWSPMVAIILLSPSVVLLDNKYQYYDSYDLEDLDNEFAQKKPPVARWVAYSLLLVVVLLMTVAKLGDRALSEKQEFWRRLVLNLCMVGAIVMASFALGHDDVLQLLAMIITEVLTLVLFSFGNFLIPAAIVRVVLPLLSFSRISNAYKDNTAMLNLAASLYIFYGTVLGQGALYVVACMFEIFSCIPRRSLVRRGGFKGQWGMDSVSQYYAYALEKCLERNVLAPKISLCSSRLRINQEADPRDPDSTHPSTEGANQDTATCTAQRIVKYDG